MSERLDLDTVRRRLAQARGPAFWRSLEELAATDAFRELIEREFPRQAAEWAEGEAGFDRRRFLQLASASLALAGLTACTRQPSEKIVAYVRQPEEIVPGRPLYFATGMPLGGYTTGLLVESHMGRPTKVEGNPDHPASLGSTDLFAQAAVLGLYDPDRSQVVTHLGAIRTWPAFLADLRGALRAGAATGATGEGVRLLTGSVTSPSLAAGLRGFLQAFPGARWHQWEPAGRDAVRAGARAAFGAPLETRYDLEAVDVLVTLDADFLTTGPGAVRYARQLVERRRVRRGPRFMRRADRAERSRFYAVESTPTPTGTVADHRLALAASRLPRFALDLAAALGVPGAGTGPGAAEAGGAEAASGAAEAAFLLAAAADLRAAAGRGLVVAGDQAPPEVHVLAHAVNAALGNAGTTVDYSEPVEAEPVDQLASLRELVAEMAAGRVGVLVVLGVNPVYDAPADLEFAAAMGKVPLRAHLGLYADETAEYCHWHVPEAHFLESWGDGRAFDGTVTLQQPLIEPLYGGKTALEVVAALATTEGEPTADELVRGHWQRLWQLDASADPHHFAPFTSFEEFWKRALHDGLLAGSVLEPRAAAPAAEAVAAASRSIAAAAVASPEALELAFRPDPTVWDGRFANNGWLQECPKPITKLTWDNALLVAPLTAERLGLRHEDLVEVTAGGRRARLPVWVLPGQAAGTLTVHLGYGRRRAGRVGSGAGFDAYALRGTGGLWLERGVAVRPTGERYRLASTQLHNNIPQESEQAQARHLVRVLHPDELDVGAAGAAGGEGGEEAHGGGGHGEAGGRPPSIYPEVPYTGYAWGMAIDLDACTGCNACVVACQAENNVPVVGKEQVLAGREMHWLRIDRYYQGSLDDPAVVHQPVLCMHCELAPCEVVCPVAATVHSAEGLNDMIYNRCVGTRYCSNNCPYKVRRFNFLHYSKIEAPVLELLQNPDVTVRSRGVMEKCTYCVQRINQARIRAGVEGRKVRDGEIVTACQQACPTQAIVFGDVNDPQSQVAAWKAEPANYTLLDELGTRPRTSYLARLRSPSPDLEGG